jgi:hypothetical protein
MLSSFFQSNKEKLSISNKEENSKESKEPDNDEDLEIEKRGNRRT